MGSPWISCPLCAAIVPYGTAHVCHDLNPPPSVAALCECASLRARLTAAERERKELCAWNATERAAHDETSAALAAAERERAALDGVVKDVLAALYDATGDTETRDLAALGKRVASLATERDEASDRLDAERIQHDETRGYRAHAEQERDAARAEAERLRGALDITETALDTLVVEHDRGRARIDKYATDVRDILRYHAGKLRAALAPEVAK